MCMYGVNYIRGLAVEGGIKWVVVVFVVLNVGGNIKILWAEFAVCVGASGIGLSKSRF